MTSHLDLDALTLQSGSHSNPEAGMCVMEAVAFFAHEPFSDHPECASPVLTSFLMSWNDSLSDEPRQRLKRFIPAVVGTRTTSEDEQTRAWLATDWLVRTFTPTWLDRAGLTEDAAALRALDALTSTELAATALPIIKEARKKSAAAWAAAGDAAGAAAGAAAWAAAGDAAWDAAGAAAWAAAGDAAWDAAGAAAGAAAWAAAGAAAGAAAWAAAGDAAWDAAGDGKSYSQQYDAAYKAARPLIDEAFADTIAELQASAEELVERMIAVGRTAEVGRLIATFGLSYISVEPGDHFKAWQSETDAQHQTLDLVTGDSEIVQQSISLPDDPVEAEAFLASLATAVNELRHMVASRPERPPQPESEFDVSDIPF